MSEVLKDKSEKINENNVVVRTAEKEKKSVIKSILARRYASGKKIFEVTILFSAIVFMVLLITLAVMVVGILILNYSGALEMITKDMSFMKLLVIIAVICLIVGTILSYLVGRFPLRTVMSSINAMEQLARGNYKARVKTGSLAGRMELFVRLAASFNNMADQLEKTELLRSDFINNFSHEFKTPIVSIAGFAKLLKKGNLTPEEQAEYLDIIEEESMRLSHMATDVMYMTRIENQSNLTELKTYNVSEQIRNCFLLLEHEWTSKNIDIEPDIDEHFLKADEEMMRHVWVNLIGNAIKFTPNNGKIIVSIDEDADTLSVRVTNTGSSISKEEMNNIFIKFYQIDKSRNTKGNGIGLAVVKRVVELHKGTISVESEDGLTSFIITLPKY